SSCGSRYAPPTSLAFDETVAETAEIHVEGRNFYPPMLDDIAAASSSVHIDQFGFRPGTIGEQFATVLLAKRAEASPVRPVVDSQGSDRDGSSREFYERLHAARVEIRVVRATRPITTAIAELLDRAGTTLDVVNPYVTDRGMIRRIERAARRGARVRLFVPANADN